jgi:monothiol glutaredoxin
MSIMTIPELSPKEAQEFLRGHPEAKLVDVRTDEEYAAARIAGAMLVNTPEKAQEILKLPKETPIVFHCHHGMRSLQAALWFEDKGFTTVYNLAGGIDAWSQDVDPKVRRY